MNTEPGVDGYRGVRALVFGATGFIGVWVARALARSGAHVSLVARDPGAAEPIRSEIGTDTEILKCDALDDAAVASVVRLVRPHVTFNLVGYGVDRHERDELLAQRLNADFPVRLAEAVSEWRADRWPGAAIVHAGTQLEYGPIPVLREDTACEPDTLYGSTKLEGTLGLARLAVAADLPALTARLFTVFGPGELPGRLLPSLIEVAVRGGDLPLTTGTQRMDFVHVEDVAEGLLRLGRAEVEPGLVANLASGHLTTVREFVITAAGILGIEEERLRFGALQQRPGTMRYDSVETARLRTLTDWMPRLSIAEGIRRTIERYGLTHVDE
jgi:nucleoside-diphosphate-sugar epimerase